MKNNWKVYIIRCKDNSLYTGITTDVDRRMKQHRNGNGSKFVRSRLPFKLVYLESNHTRSSASKREAEIKSYHKSKKEDLVENTKF